MVSREGCSGSAWNGGESLNYVIGDNEIWEYNQQHDL